MQGHLIVANCLDGTIQKGTSLDVDPKRPTCHLKTATGGMIEVALAEVKALFFVKTATGRPDYNDARDVAPGDSRLVGARRVRVAGELRYGNDVYVDFDAQPSRCIVTLSDRFSG